MDPALKRKWVKALLSGEYKQGAGRLEFLGRHCCLGVLRAVHKRGDGRSYNNENALLSRGQLKEIGLDWDVQEELANLNDKGVPFDMIAGLIDEAL